MTATLTGAVYSLAIASTARASSTTSISARPHEGQAVISKPFSRIPSDLRIAQQTGTSSIGSAASETRIVSPMPFPEQNPQADRALDRAVAGKPRLGDAEVERVGGTPLREPAVHQPVRIDRRRPRRGP